MARSETIIKKSKNLQALYLLSGQIILALIFPFLLRADVNLGYVSIKKIAHSTTNINLKGTADDQTITFPALPTKVRNDVDFAPGASASSGLAVTYASSNTAVATIVSNKIRINGVGTAIIRASQAGNAFYNPAVPVDQVLTVTMAQQSINFPDISPKPLNTPNFSPNATASSGLIVTYTSSNTAVATIVSGQIHIVGLGTSVITANQPGNASYDAAPSVSKTLTVDSRAQFITFPLASLMSFTLVDFDSPASSSSNLPVTVTSSNPLVATIVAGKIHIAGVGTTVLTASQAGNASFDPAPDVNKTLTVVKAGQTITFPALDSKAVTAPDFDPGATSNSQLPITYTTSNPDIATIVDGKIHIVGPGLVTIIASQEGNANFEAAANKFRDLNVGGNSPSKLNRTIAFKHPEDYFSPPEIKSYGDPDFNLQAELVNTSLPVIYSTNNSAVATIVNNKVHIVGLGSFVLTLSVPADDTYNAAPNLNVEYLVGKGTPVITFPAIPAKSTTDADFDPGASNNKGLPLTYSSSNLAVATIVAGKIHIVGNGTTTITASQDETAYYVARSASSVLNVSSTSQTVTFPPIPDKQLNSADFNPGATASSGLPITYTSSNLAVATIISGMIHIVGTGTTVITATQVGNVTYLGASATANFTVTKINQSITFPELAIKLLTAPDFWPGAIASSYYDVQFTSSNPAVATIVDQKIHIVGVGSTTITGLQPGDDRYAAAEPVARTLTVIKSPQILTFPDITPKSVTTLSFYPQATATPGFTIVYLSSNPAVATVSGDAINIVGAGTSIITASLIGSDSYDPANDVSKTLVVNGNNQVISFVGGGISDKTYGDSDFDPGATASSGLPITYTSSNLAVATIVAGKIHIVGAGTTNITATQAGNSTFAPTSNTVPFNVSKSDQVITFPAITKLRSDPDFDPGATSSSGLPITYSTLSETIVKVVDGKLHIVSVGMQFVKATQEGNANFNAASTDQLITINKGTQTITFPDLPVKGTSDPDFDPGATTSSGLALAYTSSNPAVATIVAGKIHIVGLGTTTITAAQSGDSNYDPAIDVSKTLTVSGTSQTVSFAPLPVKTFGDADFDPAATASSGLSITYTSSNLAVATIVAGKIHITGAGTTNITALQNGNTTYSSASSTVTLTVIKSNQAISFASIPDKLRTDADFDPGATVSSGLSITYTSSNLAVATIVAGKIHIVGTGTTTITASQNGNANYNAASAISVNFTVSSLTQTITFAEILGKKVNDPDFDPGAISSAGLAITYTSSNPDVATIVSNKVHIVGGGSTTITALQAGDAIYAPASKQITLTISKLQQTITFPPIALKKHSDLDFDPNATSSAGLPISYTSSNLAVATIIAGKVHIVAAGSTVITAAQSGNTTFSAANSITQNLDVTYDIPVNNFKIKATDETCKTSNNGAINITTLQSLNYTASITTNGVTTTYPFNSALAVNNLQAGAYNVCITIAGQPSYKQCFDVTIKEPKDLAVYSSIKENGTVVLLKLEGSEKYIIDLNGQLITTTNQEISLPLIKGNNIIKIASDKTCQGVITKSFLTTNVISLYPNPVKDILNITTPNNAKVEIRSLDGRLVHNGSYTNENGQITIDMSKLNKGLYILTLSIGNSKTVHKVIKD